MEGREKKRQRPLPIIGRPRPMLTIATMRGWLISIMAMSTTTTVTITIVFG